jgi:hypothetical protein
MALSVQNGPLFEVWHQLMRPKKETPADVSGLIEGSAGVSYSRDRDSPEYTSSLNGPPIRGSGISARVNCLLRGLAKRNDICHDGPTIHAFVVVFHQIWARRVSLDSRKVYGRVTPWARNIPNRELHMILRSAAWTAKVSRFPDGGLPILNTSRGRDRAIHSENLKLRPPSDRGSAQKKIRTASMNRIDGWSEPSIVKRASTSTRAIFPAGFA